MRITVVEDNEGLAKGIAWKLRDSGHAVDVLHDGLAADAFLQDEASDVIILDITLPGMDGLEVLRALRARRDGRPVLLLTARAETTDRVTGLDAGADDYLVKPFEMAELEARVRALARRPAVAPAMMERIGPLEFDHQSRVLKGPDGAVALPRRERAVLECLIAARGRVLSKQALLEQLYGAGGDVGEGAVEVYVSRLRTRLKPYGVVIQAQRGVGYQLVEETGG